MLRTVLFTTLILSLGLAGCKQAPEKKTGKPSGKEFEQRFLPKPYVLLKHPEWSKNATIYEVNVRQYTPEGTFKAFGKHLPRLKKMGVDIIWLMPINPIGIENRKGKLGSYYSVRDYFGVNPEFGDLEDLKRLVDTIHEMGMHVIIDWVANHSAWDNPLTTEHPEWYTKTREGNFQPTPWYDWTDIIDFDYDQPGLRKYMTEAMKYWVKEADIDGYRCDVAGFIPVDFWENVRAELDSIKPMFMLAEWESRDLHRKAFDMTYAWSLWNELHAITAKGKSLDDLIVYLSHDVNAFPKNGYRMTFTDNHDKNSWEGNQYANFGKGLHAAMVFCGVVRGMPLVYSGQEAGLNRSLAFFDKDLIDWKENANAGIYTRLFNLKHKNQALWNGNYGGEMIRIFNDQEDKVISFFREKNGDMVLPVFNFSDQIVTVKLHSENYRGSYHELFSGEEYVIGKQAELTLQPWGFLVLTNQEE